MNTVECPKCTLRFEPDELLSFTGAEVFCPQCGNRFQPAAPMGQPKEASAYQTA